MEGEYGEVGLEASRVGAGQQAQGVTWNASEFIVEYFASMLIMA
jgi:hypothetical protein